MKYWCFHCEKIIEDKNMIIYDSGFLQFRYCKKCGEHLVSCKKMFEYNMILDEKECQECRNRFLCYSEGKRA